MAFDETFRYQPKINEEEVFELIGRAQTVRQLEPSNFEGPVAHWANDRMRRFGETIIPRHVYVEQKPYGKPHRVAWVYHDGFNIDTGVPFCMHHIACDCTPDVDRVDDLEEKQRIMNECDALLPVLDRQAELINYTYGVTKLLEALSFMPGAPMEEQNAEVQNFISRSIVYVLEHDYRHPESWMANVESGWNLINLQARVFQISPADLGWLAEALASQEVVETDGVVIELSQRLKDNIDAEKAIREATAVVERELAA